MKRILLAGLVAGIAMFAWSSIAHMMLPLGTIGIREIPNEPAVLNAMQASIGTNSGMYLFPGMGLGPNPSNQEVRDAMPAYEKKLAASPFGILIYHSRGISMSARRLGTEFATELIEAMLAIVLLSLTRLNGYLSRVAFVTAIGLIASITTNVSYWNWYGFPGNYTAAYTFTQLIGFLAAGLVGAAILRCSAEQVMTART